MWKNRCKPALTCLLVIGLHAGSVSMNIVNAYDGDIDYSAPYVTLDPKTGKLITVDPKQQQADGQTPPPHPNAPPQDATASQPETATTAAAAPDTAANPAGTTTPVASSTGTNVMAAVLGLVLIAGVVAVLRRKPAAEKSGS